MRRRKKSIFSVNLKGNKVKSKGEVRSWEVNICLLVVLKKKRVVVRSDLQYFVAAVAVLFCGCSARCYFCAPCCGFV